MAALARTLRDPDQQDHLAIRDDRPGIEDPDDLEIVTRGSSDPTGSRAAAQNAASRACRAPSSSSLALGLSQAVGGTGDGQRIPAVVLSDLSRVRMVGDPRDLVGHDRSEQLAITM